MIFNIYSLAQSVLFVLFVDTSQEFINLKDCLIYTLYFYLLVKSMKEVQVYFERQSMFSLYCGLHSVNNLLGDQIYSSSSLNEICYQLSSQLINPHKHIFGGDYDINVLMIALQNQHFTCSWFDIRRPKFNVEQIKDEKHLRGYLVNLYIQPTFSILQKIFRISNRHWIAVRKIGEDFYYMDSKAPYEKMNKEKVRERLQGILDETNEDGERAQIIEIYQQTRKEQNQQ